MNYRKLLFLLPVAAAVGSATGAQKPNVIIILADDLGCGDVSALGSKTLTTPNIDRLATGGIVMANGYASSPTSTPSRYAILTGRYPWRREGAKVLPGDANLLIDLQQPTLPKMMKSAGYATAVVGKWHLGLGDSKIDWNGKIAPGPNEIGFDYSCILAATNDRVPCVYVENGRVANYDADHPIYVDYANNFPGEPTGRDNPGMLKMMWSHSHNCSIVDSIGRIGYMKGGGKALWVDEQMADYFAGKVRNFIDANSNRPFFLYYALHEPHVPRVPNPRFAGKSGFGPRGDVILEADWCVGEVLATLEKHGILDNTLIIFSSDNGPVLDDGYQDQSKELWGRIDYLPAAPFRGGKYSLFEGGCHVPMIVYWRGTVAPGRSEALVSQVDWLASLATLAGAAQPVGVDSRDELNALLGRSTQARDELLMGEGQRLAIRRGDWIMIPPHDGETYNVAGVEMGNMPDYALYNLKDDPGQRNNLASANPAKLAEMKAAFDRASQEGLH